jgi:hypothetical protein
MDRFVLTRLALRLLENCLSATETTALALAVQTQQTTEAK